MSLCENGRQKTHRNDCEQSREGVEKTRRGERLRVVKGRLQHRETKTNADSPIQRRDRKHDIDEVTRRTDDMRSKGGGRLKHCNVDGDVPLCLRRKLEDNKESSSSESKKYEGKESGSGNQKKMKNCVMNNMASGSKELQSQYTAGKDQHVEKQGSHLHHPSEKT